MLSQKNKLNLVVFTMFLFFSCYVYNSEYSSEKSEKKDDTLSVNTMPIAGQRSIHAVALNKKGDLALTACKERIRSWMIKEREIQPSIFTEKYYAKSIAFSPHLDQEDLLVYIGLSNGTLMIWNFNNSTDNPTITVDLSAGTHPVNSISINSKGYLLAAVNSLTKLYKPFGCGSLKSLGHTYHSSIVKCAVSSNDGNYIISGTEKGYIYITDTSSLSNSKYNMHEYDSPIESIAISPDSKYILAGLGNNHALLYNSGILENTNPNIIRVFQNHNYPVRAVGFDEYYDLLIITSDKILTIYKVKENQNHIYEFKDKHSEEITSIATVKHLILTGSNDTTALLWKILKS